MEKRQKNKIIALILLPLFYVIFCTNQNPSAYATSNNALKSNIANPFSSIKFNQLNKNTRNGYYNSFNNTRVDDIVGINDYTDIARLASSSFQYSILYNDPSIVNMPTDISSTTPTSSVNISANTPKKNGYTFIGWCDTIPTTSAFTDTCSGNIYSPNDPYILNQTSSTNNLDLYAMWQRYTMQNVSEWKGTLKINDETTAIDTRDGKTYSVARLCMNTSGCTTGAEDPNDTNSKLWMTQNLDLVVGQSGVAVLTSNDSDLNSGSGTIYATGYSTSDGVITWTPDSRLNGLAYSSAHNSGNNTGTISGWTNENSYPHQGEGGDFYVFISGNSNNDIIYKSLNECVVAGHTAKLCQHYHVGNYYNWTAAVASNNSSSLTANYSVAANSICPKGWRLPKGLSGTNANNDNHITEFNRLAIAYGVTTGRTTALSTDANGLWENIGWTTNGLNIWLTAPLYFVRSGGIDGTLFSDFSTKGFLWSSTVRSSVASYYLHFEPGALYPATQYIRGVGFSVRCIAR